MQPLSYTMIGLVATATAASATATTAAAATAAASATTAAVATTESRGRLDRDGRKDRCLHVITSFRIGFAIPQTQIAYARLKDIKRSSVEHQQRCCPHESGCDECSDRLHAQS